MIEESSNDEYFAYWPVGRLFIQCPQGNACSKTVEEQNN